MTDQIIITVTPLPEHCPVRGHFATGDDVLDRKAEDAILARLDRDDLWGWCEVRVRATWTAPTSGRAWHGDAYLGCCSYDGEADWREPGGYHEQMAIEATEALYEALRADVAEAAEAAEFLSTHPLTSDAPVPQ